ncbi:RagB/SusD family nutrient uptake outer membrane protein [Sphingobacterium alkalisoli]|uniref:RagB/SusD family nutrient uptake outer membrane protein n=1 Tax=Sphingobacterium alkalisoli TaxID=1874115 RepID=A0A4U0H983_9SPHI|nr:RagB/SusD family nutrient uptake outer membrane protein [Sphingobacterium alkalisoli]TJY68391.1 RagB/SusD family nutrient uptake outer membrane protein [Sphingobacterium alkalisoli]GGH06812.1 hypothetical protein GCM10011418_03710 [Sphingobacterium alkalisoli]
MKLLNKIKYYVLGIICTMTATGCEEFLDQRISHSSKVASSLSDLQALLDAENFINLGGYPFLLEVGTDDYQMDHNSLGNLTAFDQSTYKFIWTDLYPPVYLGVWVNSYKPISISNIVMESLEKMGQTESAAGRNIRGQALFHRAFGHFMLAQVFCLPYDKDGTNAGLGIPLRHSSDANINSQRSTIKETYDDILKDMNEAVVLLNETNGYLSRPNTASAYAALSRIYLAMELYDESERAATACLARQNTLIDLNTIDLGANYPYNAMNVETIFFACGSGSSLLSPSRGSVVSTELYNLFEPGDLRLQSYFRSEGDNGYSFKGNYMGFGSGTIFSGLTTSEVLLNRAECYARGRESAKARADLNRLLINRIDKASFKPVDEDDTDVLLKLILDERRKELINRSIRWLDLRRLNKDERFKKTIVRTLVDQGVSKEYKLLPNSESYVFKIPKDVIDITGMHQN